MKMHATSDLFAYEDWLLTPEGAIYHPAERTAVIADVHLGYEWARGKAGDSILAHSLPETVARLETVFHRIPGSISTLIVAGDLVESSRACRRTSEDVQRLRSWFEEKRLNFVRLTGNHDLQYGAPERNLSDLEELRDVAGWTVGHGHKPIPGLKTISGHLHPIFRFQGISTPCFLVSSDRIILPAFSQNTAGLDVLSQFHTVGFRKENPRCVVSTGETVLDFGSLYELPARMRADRSISGVAPRR